MLERLQDYVMLELQIPLMCVFIIGWLVGGSMWIRHEAAKHSERELRTITFGRGVILMFLSGLVGAIAGGMILGMGVLLYGVNGSMLMLAGFAVLGLAVMLAMGFLMMNSLVNAPAKCVWQASWKAIFGTVALLAFIGILAVLPPRIRNISNVDKNQTMMNLSKIKSAILDYRATYGLPESIDNLIKPKEWIDRKFLKNKVHPDLDIGFFCAAPEALAAEENPTKALLVVSLAKEGLDGRAVLFYSGEIKWLSDKQIDELLALEVNANFAKRLAEAEANRGQAPPPSE